jgi:hypothetical protein
LRRDQQEGREAASACCYQRIALNKSVPGSKGRAHSCWTCRVVYCFIGLLAHWLLGSLAHWLIGSLAHWVLDFVKFGDRKVSVLSAQLSRVFRQRVTVAPFTADSSAEACKAFTIIPAEICILIHCSLRLNIRQKKAPPDRGPYFCSPVLHECGLVGCDV